MRFCALPLRLGRALRPAAALRLPVVSCLLLRARRACCTPLLPSPANLAGATERTWCALAAGPILAGDPSLAWVPPLALCPRADACAETV